MTAATTAPLTIAQKLDELFKPWNRSDAPGVIVGVARKGRVIYRRGFGLASIEHAVALTPATRMRIGSTTKHFCSLGILLLAEEGKLDINEPVGSYLPELSATCARPTLLQLMHHTGGLHDPMAEVFMRNGGHYSPLAVGGHLQMMARLDTCNFEPGTRFAYCNSGYQLLSTVTERISGQSWDAFLQERILQPMGMHGTANLSSDMEIVPGMATLHIPLPNGGWRRGIFPSEENEGPGGMISTVDDMLAWAAHLRSQDKKVGSAAIWQQMLERQTFAGGVTHCYALGLMHDEHRGIKTIHHAGATLGSQHQLLVAPAQELDIVVMANRMDASCPALALKVLEAVLENDGLGPEPAPVLAADYPALKGRWFSRQSKTLIEFGVRKLTPESPELLLLSAWNQPVAVMKKVGEGLAQPDSPFSTLELRQLPQGEVPSAALDVHICGERESFERLPDEPPAVEALAAEICGRYRHAAFGKDVEIALRDGKLVLDLLPLHGQGWWELQPYSAEVAGCGAYHSTPHLGLPNGASLVFERKDGKVTGFTHSSDRMRGLRFERI